MILAGRWGQVLYDETGTGTPVEIASINKFKLSQKTDKLNVTCFGDPNKVYVPSLPDLSGTVSGFWNSADRTLFLAAFATAPGKLKLIPNENEPTFFWSGLAYLDAEIDTGVETAPALSGEFMAAGPWTMEPVIP
jgi:hypothetical protein